MGELRRVSPDEYRAVLRFLQSRNLRSIAAGDFRRTFPTFSPCEVLVAAEAGRLRRFSRPDLSETHGFQRRRLRIRPHQLVFENACVRASIRDTADQQIGARRRAGRGDPCAGGSVEWFEGGDLAEGGAVVVVQGALQIERRTPVQCGAARKDLDRTLVRELTDDNALGATERAGEPARREGNAAAILLAERHERGAIHGLLGPRGVRAARACLADGLQQREDEHLDLGRAARAGSGHDALAARRKIDETGGDADPGAVVTIRFEAREERRYGARRRRQLGFIDLDFTRDAGRGSDDDVVGGLPVDLRSSDADTATRGRLEGLKARQLRSEGPSATYGCPGIGHNFRRAARPRADDQVKNAITVNIPHRYIDAAFKTGKRDDGGDEPVAIAVIETNLGRFARGAWNGDRINGGGRYDVNERHQPIVFVVEAMAMRHVKPGVFVEPGADRKDAGSRSHHCAWWVPAHWHCRWKTCRGRCADPSSDQST